MSSVSSRDHNSTASGPVYRNPLVFADGSVPTNPDPFILRWCGRYYCYATDEFGIKVSRSDDLVGWEALGYAFQLPGRANFWAPSVLYDNGVFYLYYSCDRAQAPDSHGQWLQLATSGDPVGPFKYVKTFFDKFSIDSHPVRDSRTGDYYLYYAVNDITGLEEGNPGTSIVVDRLVAFDQLAGTPAPAVVPTLPQEVYEVNRFGDGRDWHTIEGAAYVEHHDAAYLLYSANAYTGEDYHLGYARATLDRPVGDLQWHKQPGDYDWAPLVRRSDAVEGTGHNTIAKAPNLVDDWIVYHGRNLSEPRIPDAEQRTMRIDPLHYDGLALATPAPTCTDQPAPLKPTIQARLSEGTDQPGWCTVEGGMVTTTTEPATWLTDPTAARTLIVSDLPLLSYRAEIALAARVDHVGARYGVLVAYQDPQNYAEIILDAGSRSLIARAFTQNVGHVLATADLGAADLRAVHTLRLDRTFTRLKVALDDLHRFEVRLDPPPARLGIVSYRTAAEPIHFAATDHLSLFGERLAFAGQVLRSDQPILIGPHGVGTPLLRPVQLGSDVETTGHSYVHEFERHGALSTVQFRPLVTSAQTYAEVTVDSDATVVRSVVDGHTTAEFRSAPVTGRFSVRTVAEESALSVTVAGATHTLELPDRKEFRQHLHMVGATLRSLERTALHQ